MQVHVQQSSLIGWPPPPGCTSFTEAGTSTAAIQHLPQGTGVHSHHDRELARFCVQFSFLPWGTPSHTKQPISFANGSESDTFTLSPSGIRILIFFGPVEQSWKILVFWCFFSSWIHSLSFPSAWFTLQRHNKGPEEGIPCVVLKGVFAFLHELTQPCPALETASAEYGAWRT